MFTCSNNIGYVNKYSQLYRQKQRIELRKRLKSATNTIIRKTFEKYTLHMKKNSCIFQVIQIKSLLTSPSYLRQTTVKYEQIIYSRLYKKMQKERKKKKKDSPKEIANF